MKRLKGKIQHMNIEDLYADFEEKLFNYSDVKNAVGWLKDTLCTKHGGSRVSMNELLRLIDKAFEDVK